MTELRVAMVGTGWFAGRHLEVAEAAPEVRIVGVSGGRSAASREKLAGRFDTDAYDDPVEMLDRAAPDALLVCVTPGDHGVELAAAARAIPFLVEKPLAVEWDTAARIADAVAEADLLAAVGYQWRYLRTTERARELLAGRQVALAQGNWLSTTPPPAWWADPAESGGQFVEQLTHVVDLARLFMGEAEEVYAATTRVPRPAYPDFGVDEVTTAQVRFAGGALGTFTCSCVAPPSYRGGLDLLADDLVVEIGEDSLVTVEGERRTEVELPVDAVTLQDGAFFDAVRTGDRGGVRSTYADALRTHRLTTLARESAVLRRPLAVT